MEGAAESKMAMAMSADESSVTGSVCEGTGSKSVWTGI